MDVNNNLIPILPFSRSLAHAVRFASDEISNVSESIKKKSSFPSILKPASSLPSRSLRDRGSNQLTSLTTRPKTASGKRVLLPSLSESAEVKPGFLVSRAKDASSSSEDALAVPNYSLQIERMHPGRLTPIAERLASPDEKSKELHSWDEFNRPIIRHTNSSQYALKLEFIAQNIHKLVEDWNLLHTMNENSVSNNELIQEKTESLKALVQELIHAMPLVKSHLMDMILKIEEISE